MSVLQNLRNSGTIQKNVCKKYFNEWEFKKYQLIAQLQDQIRAEKDAQKVKNKMVADNADNSNTVANKNNTDHAKSQLKLQNNGDDTSKDKEIIKDQSNLTNNNTANDNENENNKEKINNEKSIENSEQNEIISSNIKEPSLSPLAKNNNDSNNNLKKTKKKKLKQLIHLQKLFLEIRDNESISNNSVNDNENTNDNNIQPQTNDCEITKEDLKQQQSNDCNNQEIMKENENQNKDTLQQENEGKQKEKESQENATIETKTQQKNDKECVISSLHTTNEHLNLQYMLENTPKPNIIIALKIPNHYVLIQINPTQTIASILQKLTNHRFCVCVCVCVCVCDVWVHSVFCL